ncbi:hypothetical protein FHG87_025465 [Trinorchestia longiramus]|nr:hypothetical protein FHG87_025465 [Trinorchestia longiramus]
MVGDWGNCRGCGSIGSPATYKRSVKRSAPRGDSADRQMGEEEEEWLLKEVVFLEDTRPQPLGEVLAVDGDQVVILPYNKDGAPSKSTSSSGSSAVPSNLRVIHRDQLSVVRGISPAGGAGAPGGTPSTTCTPSSTSSSSRAPDCYQRTPRKVPLVETDSTMLAVAVDNRGEVC